MFVWCCKYNVMMVVVVYDCEYVVIVLWVVEYDNVFVGEVVYDGEYGDCVDVVFMLDCVVFLFFG